MALMMETAWIVLFGWAFVGTTSLIFSIFVSIKSMDYEGGYVAMLQVRIVYTILTLVVILVMCETELNQKVRICVFVVLLNENY